ncbi:MAG TPA: roadblock/LC7 domain-containing protein [Micromonosporaceae bacterium]
MTGNRDWGYLLDGLCDQVPGLVHALAVSGDGMKIATSRHLPVEQADQLSAFTSGVASLTHGAARLMNGGAVEHNLVEMTNGLLVMMAIDEKSTLTVVAAKDCDLGQVTYEMASLINRVAGALAPDVRQPQRA